MFRHLLLGTAAAIAVLVVAFGGAGLVVHADGGGSISGRIIHDIDGDGDRADIDEPGLSNWRVELREQTEGGESAPVETRTDRNGEFSFDGLEPGDYSVSIPCEGQPHLWLATWPSSSTWNGVTIEEGIDSGADNLSAEDSRRAARGEREHLRPPYLGREQECAAGPL